MPKMTSVLHWISLARSCFFDLFWFFSIRLTCIFYSYAFAFFILCFIEQFYNFDITLKLHAVLELNVQEVRNPLDVSISWIFQYLCRKQTLRSNKYNKIKWRNISIFYRSVCFLNWIIHLGTSTNEFGTVLTLPSIDHLVVTRHFWPDVRQ